MLYSGGSPQVFVNDWKMTLDSKVFEPVGGRYHGPQLEKSVLEFWERNSVFEKTLQQSEGRPRFSFNEGPPTANGKPGIHHVLARTFKDIYPRFKTMRGFHAPRKGGWDTHGLPVEHEVEKQLGIFDKKEIESRVGIHEFNRRCRASVMTCIGEWEALTRRMGYWVNLDEAYYTLDNRYIESVWNLLRRIWDKGLIYKGYKVVPYDPRIGATLSSHEVAQGYREVEDPSVTVRFRLEGQERVSFLVWTTTPWTLPSNLLLAVGADVDYAWVRHNDEILILACARVGRYFAERDQPCEIIRTVKGSELAGLRYDRLFDWLDIEFGDCFRVVSADFVNTEDGTGIVHIAPAYGVDDLALGQREGLPVVHGVGLDGCFMPPAAPVSGLFFKQADPVICKLLDQQGNLFLNETTRHSYPFGWRTGDPLIYYAKEAWYIRTTAIRKRMVALNKTIHWVPETIRDGRFGRWLENNVDWALSRERFWGTPLPLWTDGQGGFMCIGSLDELEALTGQSMRGIDLHRPQIDEVTFIREERVWRRVPEVIDCWFDSGAMTYAQWHYPFENEDIFTRHFPADYICEAIDQTRGWFYTLHAIAALVDDSVAYKNCVCLSHIVDEHGKKMSKSLGNIIDPYEVFDVVGVDALRWLFLARAAPDAQKRISVEIVREVAATLINTLWNTWSFFTLYARLDQFDSGRPVAPARRPQIDRWALALAHQTLKVVTESLDRYDAFGAGQAIEKLVDRVSNWYVRRNRRRFWKSDDGNDKQAAYLTLYECLDLIARMIAPFMPFLGEALYQSLGKYDSDCKQSVHLAVWPQWDAASLDDDLVHEMEVVQTIVGLGRSAREESRIRVRQPLSQMLVSSTDRTLRSVLKRHEQLILEELNVKAIDFINSDQGLIRHTIKPNFPRLGKRYGKLMPAIQAALGALDGDRVVRRMQEDKALELQVEGREIVLERDDIQILTSSAQGFAACSGQGCLVALNTSLDNVLLIEGVARELVRTVQDARKSAGLEISDRISLCITGTPRVCAALRQHRQTILDETLAVDLVDSLEGGFMAERSLDDDNWVISLSKAAGTPADHGIV